MNVQLEVDQLKWNPLLIELWRGLWYVTTKTTPLEEGSLNYWELIWEDFATHQDAIAFYDLLNDEWKAARRAGLKMSDVIAKMHVLGYDAVLSPPMDVTSP